MLDKAKAPAEVLADQSRGGKDVTSTDEAYITTQQNAN